MGSYISWLKPEPVEKLISWLEPVEKLSKDTEKYLMDHIAKIIEVVFVTKMPYDDIPREILKENKIIMVSDMTAGGKNACFIRGKAYDILLFVGNYDWVLEVQRIPGLIAC